MTLYLPFRVKNRKLASYLTKLMDKFSQLGLHASRLELQKAVYTVVKEKGAFASLCCLNLSDEPHKALYQRQLNRPLKISGQVVGYFLPVWKPTNTQPNHPDMNTLAKLGDELEQVITMLMGEDELQSYVPVTDPEDNPGFVQTFLTRMSHEVKTPLNAIMGFAQLLADCQDQEKQQVFAQHIVSSSVELDTLFVRLMESERWLYGSLNCKQTPIDVSAACNMAVAACQQQFPGRTIHTSIDEGLWMKGNEQWLIKAVTELLGNAFKCGCAQNCWLLAELHEMQLRIFVVDDGKGMDFQEDHVEELPMEVFANISDFPIGSGFGLPIAGRLIKHLGGQLSIYSQPMEGTHAEISIPL